MKKEPLFVTFCTQKGGAGKSSFTILAASIMYYLKGYNVIVVDCDFPQHSIHMLRNREFENINENEELKLSAYSFFKALGKKAFPILASNIESALGDVKTYLECNPENVDVVFFDLPGTIATPGVLNLIASMDYLFTPVTADRLELESSLSFASVVNENIILKNTARLKGMRLFWNQVDRREKTDMYHAYAKVIYRLGLELMNTQIPNMVRMRKALSENQKIAFRSTMFPPDKRQIRGSNMEELVDEICQIINLK